MSYQLRRRRGLGDTAPWGTTLIADPTGNSWVGLIPYSPEWYATQATADTIAAATGGTVVDSSGAFANNQPMFDVTLQNGVSVNAGALASIYTNPTYSQAVADGEAAKLLNSDACITEWGNVVSNCVDTPTGTYSVKGGVVTYQPGVAPTPYQAPVISQTQYAAWLAKGGPGTPISEPTMINAAGVQVPRVVTSSNSAIGGAPSAGAPSAGAPAPGLLNTLMAGTTFGIPNLALAAAVAALFVFGGGGNGR